MSPEDRTDPTSAPGAEPADAERLFGVAYDRLRSLARRHLGVERSDHTLQPTALVHEAYVRLADQRSAFDNETHFVAIASRAMRRISSWESDIEERRRKRRRARRNLRGRR